MKNDENGHQVSLQYDFPWGTAPIETIQNLGDSLVREAEIATDVGHQVIQIFVAHSFLNSSVKILYSS